MLKMKSRCQKCGQGLTATAEVYICSYECTFCPQCTANMASVCPNCGGELIRRPKRTRGVVAVATDRLFRKVRG